MLRQVVHLTRRVLGHFGKRSRSIESWEKWHQHVVQKAVDRVVPHLPEDGLFIDVGANIGTFAKLLRQERPRARGILFEPVAAYYERCAARFADDPLIEVVHAGLGDVEKRAPIFKARHNFGANSLLEEIMFDRRPNSLVSDKTVIDEEEVTIHHFAEWLRSRGIEHLDVVKSDTEGYDSAVLRGLAPWIERTGCRPVINVEMLEEEYHPFPGEQRAALEAYYALGYSEVDLEKLDWTVADVLLVPEDRTEAE